MHTQLDPHSIAEISNVVFKTKQVAKRNIIIHIARIALWLASQASCKVSAGLKIMIFMTAKSFSLIN